MFFVSLINWKICHCPKRTFLQSLLFTNKCGCTKRVRKLWRLTETAQTGLVATPPIIPMWCRCCQTRVCQSSMQNFSAEAERTNDQVRFLTIPQVKRNLFNYFLLQFGVLFDWELAAFVRSSEGPSKLTHIVIVIYLLDVSCDLSGWLCFLSSCIRSDHVILQESLQENHPRWFWWWRSKSSWIHLISSYSSIILLLANYCYSDASVCKLQFTCPVSFPIDYRKHPDIQSYLVLYCIGWTWK